jgi:hypothetical protein
MFDGVSLGFVLKMLTLRVCCSEQVTQWLLQGRVLVLRLFFLGGITLHQKELLRSKLA